jgi:hypothetical protein
VSQNGLEFDVEVEVEVEVGRMPKFGRPAGELLEVATEVVYPCRDSGAAAPEATKPEKGVGSKTFDMGTT